ncbi:Exosome component 10 [Trichinella spiralis]|uniref:Exosome component 10 n=1 Tax=Trichinella spiralis TaxID=6334 RepID=A0A0V1B581_TRISP|nr:Exosome component 10 [Trichinella spiralis]
MAADFNLTLQREKENTSNHRYDKFLNIKRSVCNSDYVIPCLMLCIGNRKWNRVISVRVDDCMQTMVWSLKFSFPSNLVYMCCIANFINAVDRIIMPIAIVELAEEMKYGIYQQGWVLSAFSAGYIGSQILSSCIGAQWNSYGLLGFVVLLWSISMLVTPYVASSFPLLMFSRLLLGLGEGLGLPTIYKLFAEDVPSEKRSTAFSYLSSFASIGQTMALVCCPHLHWRWPFYLFGMVGIVWCIAWWRFLRYAPILPFEQTSHVLKSFNLMKSWRIFFCSSQLLCVYVAHFCMNWTSYIIMHWLPVYLRVGPVADWLINKRKLRVVRVRQLCTVIGLAVPAVFLICFSVLDHVGLSLLVVSLCMGFLAFNSAGHLSSHADLCRTYAGVSFAISNTLATLPGLVVGPLTADFVMQSSGRWGPVFILAAMLNLVGSYLSENFVSTLEQSTFSIDEIRWFCITICSTLFSEMNIFCNMAFGEKMNVDKEDDDQSLSDLEEDESIVEQLRVTVANLLKKCSPFRVGDQHLLTGNLRMLLVKASTQLLDLLNEAITYISETFPKIPNGAHHTMMMNEIAKINDILDERITSSFDEVRGTSGEYLQDLRIERNAIEVATASWNCISAPSKEAVETERAVENFSDEMHFHNKRRFIPKPQLKFRDQIDNSLNPFKSKLRIKHHEISPEKLSSVKLFIQGLQQHADNAGMEYSSEPAHPYYYEIITCEPNSLMLSIKEPQHPIMPLNACKLVFVRTKKFLQSLVNDLNSQQAFAVDLEHNSYRSYYGLTCLLQISTRDTDYIVDPFPIWHEMYILNEPFVDPNIVKVMHGSSQDIQWLQRDFGIYVVNLFDTYHAMEVLEMPQRSLKFLVKELVGVNLDKSYQTADWRIRPLGSKMLAYARSDSHYLLYCWDVLRNQLLNRGNEYNDLMMIVLKRSSDTCLQVYKKKFPNEFELRKLESKFPFNLDNRQKYALRMLYYWRDGVARITDESVYYIMRNETLRNLAAKLPRDMQLLENACKPITGALMPHLQEIQKIICDAWCLDLFTMKPPKAETVAVERSSVARRRPHDIYIDENKKELPLSQIFDKPVDETVKQSMPISESFKASSGETFHHVLLTSQWYAIDSAKSGTEKDERAELLLLDDFAIFEKYCLTKEIRDVNKPEPARIVWDVGYNDEQRKAAEEKSEVCDEVIKIQSAGPAYSGGKAQEPNKMTDTQHNSSSLSTEKPNETLKAFYKPYDYSNSVMRCFRGGSSTGGDSTEARGTVSASQSADMAARSRLFFKQNRGPFVRGKIIFHVLSYATFLVRRRYVHLAYVLDGYEVSRSADIIRKKVRTHFGCDKLLPISQDTIAKENKSGNWDFVIISWSVLFKQCKSCKLCGRSCFISTVPRVYPYTVAVVNSLHLPKTDMGLIFFLNLLLCLACSVTCNTLNINGKRYIRRHIGKEKMTNFAGRSLFLDCSATEILYLFQIGISNLSANTEWYERNAYGLEKVVFHENQIFWNYAKSEHGLSIRSLKRIENRIGYRCRIISNELQLVIDKDFDVAEVLHCHAKDAKSKRFCGYGNCVIEKEKFNYTFMKCVCEPGYSGLHCSYSNPTVFLYKWLAFLPSALLPLVVSIVSYCFVQCLEDRFSAIVDQKNKKNEDIFEKNGILYTYLISAPIKMDILYNLNTTGSLSVQIFAVVITLAGTVGLLLICSWCGNKNESEDENPPPPEMLQSETDCSRTYSATYATYVYTQQQSIPTLAAPQCHITVSMPPPVSPPPMESPASDALPVVTETLSPEANSAPATVNKVDLEMQSWAQGESALDTMANVPSITRSYAERLQNSLNKNFF